MKLKAIAIKLGALAVIGLLAAGCSDDDNNVGTLQQNWTIAGNTNANACTQFNASQMRLVIFDPGLFIIATEFAPCNSFGTSVSLIPDVYTGTATFLDVNGVPVSDTIALPAFNIFDDETTFRGVDFPVTAFLPR